jgi:hypothetical protein
MPSGKSSRNRSPMSDDHKAALAEGRVQGRAVRRYLEALDEHRPRRGRKRTPDSIKRRLTRIEEEMDDADALKRLQLRQERLDLTRELHRADRKIDLSALEKDFIAAAGSYSRRKGISYATWREAGVSPAVLKQAGIGRGGSGS